MSDVIVEPTERQVMDMQKRIGIIQTGDLKQITKDLEDVVRLQPKISQRILQMTREDYELFGVEPSLNL